MENVSNNKVLCLNNEALLEVKRDKILETLGKGIDVFFFYDTETTGLNPYPKGDKGRDRILEVAFTVFYLDENEEMQQLTIKDENGNELPVSFQEYINPFAESEDLRRKTRSRNDCDPKALEVHGITNAFLEGKDSLNGIKLTKPAPTFKEMKPFMERFLCFDKQAEFKANAHFVSHNGIAFDDKMLTEEIKYIDNYDPNVVVSRRFESLLGSSIDTIRLMRKMFKKKDLEKLGERNGISPAYSLDYLAAVLNVNTDTRAEVHGAMLDSEILKDAYNKLIKTKKYKAIRNKVKFNTEATAKIKELPQYSLNAVSNVESLNENASVINIVKTDASFNEGTGTVKEYVQRAKENGLKNLLMADVVSLSRFVEFYEECTAANIKPIIGTTFKVETGFDVYNIFTPEKVEGPFMKGLTMKFINMALGNEEGTLDFESLVEMGADDPVKWGAVISSIQRIEQTLSEGKKPNKALLGKIEELVSDIPSLKVDKKAKIEPYVDIIKSSPSILAFEGFDRIVGHSDLVLYANDNEGYENLKKLITIANKEGQYYLAPGKERSKGEQPVLNLKQIKDNMEGLSVLLGSENDILDRALKSGYKTMPEGVIKTLQQSLGLDKIQLQLSTREDRRNDKRMSLQTKNNEVVSKLSSDFSIPMVATQTASFAEKSDFEAHLHKYAILLDKYSVDFSFSVNRTEEEYLKSSEELNTIFANNKALMNNAAKIIESNTLSPTLHIPTLPQFKTKEGRSQAEELRARSYEGLEKKVRPAFARALEEGEVKEGDFESFKEKYKERIDYELGVIIDMDFPGYFLIKQQMVQFCKREGISVGAGRGSAAGSLVVYSLGITDVDPIEHGLIFERFLNPERKEMPDIDTDIDASGREKVLNYLREEYSDAGEGYEGAAYIMTKGTFSAKNTINYLGKSLGLTQSWYNQLAKTISNEPGTTLAKELEENEELAYRYDTEVRTRRIIDIAMKLEKNGGRQTSIGKHAGGIVVGNLISQAPITYSNGIPVVQFDKNDIESAGAVKFDLLALGNLAKVDKTLENIIELKGMEELAKHNITMDGLSYNYDNFSYKDADTYEMLQEGKSTNVFQIESNMFKGLLKLIKPVDINEITAIISLGRPGPLQAGMPEDFAAAKFDPKERHFYHPSIDHLLDETHGSMIYQEQIMAIAREMSGYTMGGADKLRKAMGKKKKEVMEAETSKFVEGAVKNNVPQELAEDIFDNIEKFSGYGFNKSHAISYALLCYKTAFLRRHYPTEYMAAVLSIDANENEYKKKIAKDIESMKELGLTLFSPQINKSENRFMAGETTAILYGFDAIAGFTARDKETVLREREEKPFKNLLDFTSRTVSFTTTEKLIKSGCMDTLPMTAQLPNSVAEALKGMSVLEKKIFKRNLVLSELEVFGSEMKSDAGKKRLKKPEAIETHRENLVKAYEEKTKEFLANKDKIILDSLNNEKELLSSYVTGHPLDLGGQRAKIEKTSEYQQVLISDIVGIMADNKNVAKRVNIACMVGDILANRKTVKGNTFSLVEGSDGSATETFFLPGDGFNRLGGQLKEVHGKGLTEGDVVGLDIGFYLDKDGEMKIKVYNAQVPKYDINVVISEDKSPKNRNTGYRR